MWSERHVIIQISSMKSGAKIAHTPLTGQHVMERRTTACRVAHISVGIVVPPDVRTGVGFLSCLSVDRDCVRVVRNCIQLKNP